MIRRIAGFLLMLWAFGFAIYAIGLPGPAADEQTDAVIVPTGGKGRIERGLEILGSGQAEEMLVTGVDPEVKPGEFAAQFDASMELMECCITLGFSAVDTRGNASEAAGWIAEHEVKSIRLVTTDWHMTRASSELARTLPEGVTMIEDGVPSEPSFGILFLEYHKMLASQLSRLWPD